MPYFIKKISFFACFMSIPLVLYAEEFFLLTSSPQAKISVLDTETKNLLKTSINEHTSSPSSLIWGAHNSLYYTTRTNNSIMQYRPETQTYSVFAEVPNLKWYQRPTSIAYGKDGNLYVLNRTYFPFDPKCYSPSFCVVPAVEIPHIPASVYRFDGQTGEFIDIFIPEESGTFNSFQLKFGFDGNLYIADSGGRILQYNGNTGNFMGNFIDDPRITYLSSIEFSPNTNLYVATEEGSIYNYNGYTGEFIGEIVQHDISVSGEFGVFTFSMDGSKIYVASARNDIILFDGESGEYLEHFPYDQNNPIVIEPFLPSSQEYIRAIVPIPEPCAVFMYIVGFIVCAGRRYLKDK